MFHISLFLRRVKLYTALVRRFGIAKMLIAVQEASRREQESSRAQT